VEGGIALRSALRGGETVLPDKGVEFGWGMHVGAVEREGISELDVDEIVGCSSVSCVATAVPESSKGAGLKVGARRTCLELVATEERISPIDGPSPVCEVV
jgi:hypothetical protein